MILENQHIELKSQLNDDFDIENEFSKDKTQTNLFV
jgi:hypothetical protein